MADQITRIMGQLEAVSTRAVRKIVLDVTSDLIEQTPVDLGWARANWIPSIGDDPSSDVAEPGDTGPQAAGIAAVVRALRSLS